MECLNPSLNGSHLRDERSRPESRCRAASAPAAPCVATPARPSSSPRARKPSQSQASLPRTACRILAPRPGIEPGPWQQKHRVLPSGPPGNSLWTVVLLPLNPPTAGQRPASSLHPQTYPFSPWGEGLFRLTAEP